MTAPSDDRHPLEWLIIKALRTVHDPEIPVNIYDLGLIYDLSISDEGHVHIRMTLTSPGCPVAGMLVQQVESKVKSVEGVTGAVVELVWDPPWTRDRMSGAVKLELNLTDDDPLPKRSGPQFYQIDRRR